MSVSKEQLTPRLKNVFIEHGFEGASLARLAIAAGLGKASLYHHFPGGKNEIGGVLVREAVSELQTKVFAQALTTTGGGARKRRQHAVQALNCVVDGFVDYVEGGRGHCILALFAQEQAPVVDSNNLGELFSTWRTALADRFEDLGHKPKAAAREANDLLNQLYGALVMARTLGEPKLVRQAAKRAKSSLEA